LGILIAIVALAFCGLVSGSIAQTRGNSAGTWFFIGFFFGPIGIIAAAVAAPTSVVEAAGKTKRCPDCAEVIQAAALKCRFCGHVFSEAEAALATRAGAPAMTATEAAALVSAKDKPINWKAFFMFVGGIALLLVAVAAIAS
jgi:hypothetical protein